MGIDEVRPAEPEVWGRGLWITLRFFGLLFLGFLAYPAAAWHRTNPAVFPVLGLFALAYARVIWRNTPVPQTNRAPCSILLALACGIAVLPALGKDWLAGLCFFASVMLLINVRPRWHRLILLGLPVGAFVVGISYLHGSVPQMLNSAVLLLIVIGVQLAVYRQLHTEVELRVARAELAQLAVVNERMRIARDVHDILGQRLSAVVLKAELAAHTSGPGRPAMLEVAAIAREALAEMRAAISGYRRTSLVVEVQSATALLGAAGVHTEVLGSLSGLPERVDQSAAWVVREAATNVIRHARAANCEIEILRQGGTVLLEVRNDRADEEAPVWGSGLTGLAERVALAGGVLHLGGRAGWFTVRAELPLADDHEEVRAGQRSTG